MSRTVLFAVLLSACATDLPEPAAIPDSVLDLSLRDVLSIEEPAAEVPVAPVAPAATAGDTTDAVVEAAPKAKPRAPRKGRCQFAAAPYAMPDKSPC